MLDPRSGKRKFVLSLLCLLVVPMVCVVAEDRWTDSKFKASLRNDAIEATFHAGFLTELHDLKTQEALITKKLSEVPEDVPLYGTSKVTLSSATVALFRGKHSGWWIEGRDPRVEPANIFLAGKDDLVDIGMGRKYGRPQDEIEIFEVRIRTYHEHWADAVDPYIAWLEEGAGYIPLSKLPPGPRPYRIQAFGVDVTQFAREYVALEFLTSGDRSPGTADWFSPKIIVETNLRLPAYAK